MTTELLGGTLIVAAAISLTVYVAALWQLLYAPHRPGLVRTAVCRIVAALLYIGVGLVSLTTHSGAVVGLAVFIAVQLLWQGNSIADVRLARRTQRGTKMPDGDPLHGSDLPPVTATVPPVAPHSDVPTSHSVPDPGPLAAPADAPISHVELATLEDVGDLDNRVTDTETRVLRVGQDVVYVAAFTLLALLLAIVTGGFLLNTRSTVHTLRTQQTAADAHLNEMEATQRAAVCTLYRAALGTYNSTARAKNPAGPTAYDTPFIALRAGAAALDCPTS